ncbi:hypothetical protein V8C34DRAFT_270882 [Trichoderma compactum]
MQASFNARCQSSVSSNSPCYVTVRIHAYLCVFSTAFTKRCLVGSPCSVACNAFSTELLLNVYTRQRLPSLHHGSDDRYEAHNLRHTVTDPNIDRLLIGASSRLERRMVGLQLMLPAEHGTFASSGAFKRERSFFPSRSISNSIRDNQRAQDIQQLALGGIVGFGTHVPLLVPATCQAFFDMLALTAANCRVVDAQHSLF